MHWIPWVEYGYNMSWHSTTKTTSFKAVYGRPPWSLLSYIPATTKSIEVDETLSARDRILELLHTNFAVGKNRMKQVYDKKHTDKELAVGDRMYLKLQNYRQNLVEHCKNHKLSPRFFGPY